MGGRGLDILLHNSTLQKKLGQRFRLNRPTQIVLLCFAMASNRILWLVHARACPSDSELWNLRSSKSTWRLALAEGFFGPTSLAPIGGLAGCWPSYPPSKTSVVCVNWTATSHLSSSRPGSWLFLNRAGVHCNIRASNLKACFAADLGFS